MRMRVMGEWGEAKEDEMQCGGKTSAQGLMVMLYTHMSRRRGFEC